MSEMWDGVAPAWEANAAFVDAQLTAATRAMLDAAGVREGAAVLDLAAGPGGAGLAAGERVGPGGSVMISDVAGRMVAVAARRASAYSQITTAVFDQSAIPSGEASFDAVINRHGLMFAEDPVAAVAEGARVLRPGGRYAAMTWDARERNPWLGVVLDAVSDQLGVPVPPPNVRGPFSLDSEGELTSILDAAGLQDVAVRAIPSPMRAASLESWWERVPQLAGPLAMALAGMEPDVCKAIADRAMEAGAATATPEAEGIVFAGSVLVGSGLKPYP